MVNKMSIDTVKFLRNETKRWQGKPTMMRFVLCGDESFSVTLQRDQKPDPPAQVQKPKLMHRNPYFALYSVLYMTKDTEIPAFTLISKGY